MIRQGAEASINFRFIVVDVDDPRRVEETGILVEANERMCMESRKIKMKMEMLMLMMMMMMMMMMMDHDGGS